MSRKKKKYSRTYLAWGIHTEQTVRYNFDTNLYEIREGERLVNIHAEEIIPLAIAILKLHEKVNV